MGFSKQEIACIPTAAVHNITGSVLETRAVFFENDYFFRHENSKNGCQKVLMSIIVSLLWRTQCNIHAT